MLHQVTTMLPAIVLLAGICHINGHAARAGDKKSPVPITKVGEYKFFDGKMIVKVTEEMGLLDYEIKISGENPGTFRADEKLKKDQAVWVFYPESMKKIYVFWGPQIGAKPDEAFGFMWHELQNKSDGKTYLVTRSGAGNLKSVASAIAAMPKAMVDALPKEFVEKHKIKK